MEYPVARILGLELDVPGLGDAYEYCIGRIPSRLRNASSLRTCDIELVAVQVNRVMVHPQIY